MSDSFVVNNLNPIYLIQSGSLGTHATGKYVEIKILTVDPDSVAVYTSLTPPIYINNVWVPNVLPGTLTLAANGIISGNLPIITPGTIESFSFSVQANDTNNGRSVRNYTIGVRDLPPVWNSGNTYNLVANEEEAFSTTLDALDANTYSIQSGTLPVGITLSPDGILSGTMPSVSSTQTFTFTIRASTLSGQFSDKVMTIELKNVNKPPVWTTPSGLIGTYNEGSNISTSVIATDPDGNLAEYRLSSGALPPGVTFNPQTGVISGTPGEVPYGGITYSFTITAIDVLGLETDRTFSIDIANIPQAPVWVTPAGSITPADEQNQYVFGFQATGIDGPIVSYSVVSGAIPSGWTLNSSNGTLSGVAETVPSGSVIYNFTIRATDSTAQSTNRIFSLSINHINTKPVWVTTPGEILSTFENTTISPIQLVATDLESNIDRYEIKSGTLPDGLVLSNSGIISGTTGNITEPRGHNYSFVVSVIDVNDLFSDITLSIYVRRVTSPPTWVTPTGLLDTLRIGGAYSKQVIATSVNNLAIAYSISSGSLPPGLSLNTSTGVISGAPLATSNKIDYVFTVLATDENDGIASNVFVISILSPGLRLYIGAPAESSIVDLNAFPVTLTISGGTTTSTDHVRTFSNSFYTSHAGGSYGDILTPVSQRYALSTYDFTLESWIYMNSYGGAGGLCRIEGILDFNITNGITGFSEAAVSDLNKLPLHKWNHVALSRSNGMMYYFINGKLHASQPNTTDYTTGECQVRLGGFYYIDGYYDYLKFWVGVGRYTTEFTPI